MTYLLGYQYLSCIGQKDYYKWAAVCRLDIRARIIKEFNNGFYNLIHLNLLVLKW